MNPLLKRYEDWGHPIKNPDIEVKKAMRINTLKIQEPVLLSRLKKKKIKLKPLPFTQNGFQTSADFNLASTPEYLQGYFYIQEPASQLPAVVLNPKPQDKVLDMAASPGSKTTQLAQLMENQGLIIALDSNKARLPKLINNLQRMGVTNTIVYHKDAKYADDLGILFDKVLLDAPCSGNFTQEKDWLKRRTIADFEKMSKLQKELLQSAVKVLKPGGTLVYSTCSLELEEDEKVIEWALDNFPLKLEPTGLEIGSEGQTEKTKLCRKLWPNYDHQGFFICCLKVLKTE